MLVRLLLFLTVLGLSVSIPLVVMAQSRPPTPPHVFVGAAAVDGTPAAEGTMITAWSEGSSLAHSAAIQGRYYLLVPQPAAGQSISFSIGDLPADQTYPWEPGGATSLDLTTQMSRPPLPSGVDMLEDNLVRLFHRDRQTGVWTFYDPLINPDFRTAVRLAPGEVYWIKVDQDQQVSHHGRETRLTAGWNVVAW